MGTTNRNIFLFMHRSLALIYWHTFKRFLLNRIIAPIALHIILMCHSIKSPRSHLINHQQTIGCLPLLFQRPSSQQTRTSTPSYSLLSPVVPFHFTHHFLSLRVEALGPHYGQLCHVRLAIPLHLPASQLSAHAATRTIYPSFTSHQNKFQQISLWSREDEITCHSLAGHSGYSHPPLQLSSSALSLNWLNYT